MRPAASERESARDESSRERSTAASASRARWTFKEAFRKAKAR